MSSKIYSTEDNLEIEASSVNGSSQEEVIDIRGDQFDGEDQADAELLNLKSYDLWALGLTTALGGHFFAWSTGLTAGFGSYIVALFLMSLAYYCLILCICELSSALPFAGGVYGLSRVTLGVYPGFLVAIMDTYKSILSTASGAWLVGKLLVAITQGADNMQFLYWALFYVYCLASNGYGGRTFWRINQLSVSISATLLLIFIFGSIKFANFDANASLGNYEGNHAWFHGGLHEFILILPSSSRFFVGIQSINLACGQIKSPKTEVPRAYLLCMSTVMFTCFAVTFVACSLPPGIASLARQGSPLSVGFALMFDILPRYALIFTVPVTFIYGSTYVYYFGQQIRAMGNSGLVHPIFGTDSARNTPVLAHLAGSVLGYAVCVAEYHFDTVRLQLNNISVLGAMTTYIAILLSYLVFHNYFPTIKRGFISPLGSYGAVYSLVIFLLCIISIAGFQDEHDAIIAFVVILALASLYYYFVVTKRQAFSEEEKKVLFTAYLVKNNRSKAHRIKKGANSRAAPRAGIYAVPSHSRTDDSINMSNNNINISNNKQSGKGDDNSLSFQHRSAPATPASTIHKHRVNSIDMEMMAGAGVSAREGDTSIGAGVSGGDRVINHNINSSSDNNHSKGARADSVTPATKEEPSSVTFKL